MLQAVELKLKTKKVSSNEGNQRKLFDMYFSRADKNVPVYENGKLTGQKKTVKYGQFKISQNLFDKLGLASKGMKHFVDDESDTTALAVVSEENATIFRPSLKHGSDENKQKSKNFKKDKLEARLIATGLIPAEGDCKVYFDLVVMSEQIEGVEAIYAITLSK